MNVKIHHAVTDLAGVTGMSILRAIVQGERDPAVLAQLRDRRCKKSVQQIAWRWLPSRRIPSLEPLARKTAAWRPPPRFSDNHLEDTLYNSRSMGYVLFPSQLTRNSQMKFQVSAAPFENETSVEDRRYRASLRGEGHSVGKVTPWGRSLRGEELSSSLLGTWPHVANGSSRSPLCWIAERDGGRSFGTCCL